MTTMMKRKGGNNKGITVNNNNNNNNSDQHDDGQYQNIEIIQIDDDDDDDCGIDNSSDQKHRRSKFLQVFDMVVVTLLTLIYFIRPVHMIVVMLPVFYHYWYMDDDDDATTSTTATTFVVPSFCIPPLILGMILSTLSFVLPVQRHGSPFWTTICLGSLLEYFDFDEVQENSPVNINESIKSADNQRYIFACQPHGMVPFAGIAWSIRQAQRSQKKKHSSSSSRRRRRRPSSSKSTNPPDPRSSVPPSSTSSTPPSSSSSSSRSEMVPTVMAQNVLLTPILKHTVGMIGCLSTRQMKQRLIYQHQQQQQQQQQHNMSSKSSSSSSTSPSPSPSTALQQPSSSPSTSCVRLYVGSATDVLFCTNKIEMIGLSKHKKFIQIAMQTGTDIIPVYEFGNTAALNVWPNNNKLLTTLSRWIQFPVTLVWGRYMLPIPKQHLQQQTDSPQQQQQQQQQKRLKLVVVVGQPLGIPHIARPRQRQVDDYHRIYCMEVRRLFDTYKHKTLVIN